jgi:hypothetical protein
MQKFIVVSFTETEFPQEFPDQEWPFHVTLLGSFSTHMAKDELGRRLGEACAPHAPITVTGKSRELFGPHNDVPVTEVFCPDALATLRADIIRGFGTFVEYASRPYPTYRPHVTDQRGGHLRVGDTATLRSASIIQKIGEQRVVVYTAPLSGS